MKQAIFVNLRPIEGKYDHLADMLETMLVETRKAAGCLAACLCRAPKHNELVIWHLWERPEDFDKYLDARANSQGFRAVLDCIDHELTERAYDILNSPERPSPDLAAHS